jgi:chromosome partitioning protein
MLKVAIFNFKGGTGKSTTAINLEACLATNKRKVLLIDLDGQRTASFGLGLDGLQPTALDFLAGEKVEPVKTSVKNLWLIPGDLDLFDLETDADLFTPALAKLNGFDVCLIDCSPGLAFKGGFGGSTPL